MKKKTLDILKTLGALFILTGIVILWATFGPDITIYPSYPSYIETTFSLPFIYGSIIGTFIFLIGISLMCISFFATKKKWSIIMVVILIIISIFVVYNVYFETVWIMGVRTSPEPGRFNISHEMTMKFRIEAAKYYTGGWVNATIRNIGTLKFDVGKLGAYVDEPVGETPSVYSPNTTGNYLIPGQTININITNGTAACPNKTLIIVLESGLEESKTISC
jgi:hypothetical protein